MSSICEATPGLTTVDTSVPPVLTEAVAVLWRIPPPGPDNLLSNPRFKRLRDTCDSLYPQFKSKNAPGFALSNALRALGLPCQLLVANEHLALPAEIAAGQLDAAFRRTQVSRVYLCPLDLAEDLPELKFGPNSIRKFTAAKLEALVDLPRLQRVNSNWMFDAARFSEFRWLVVEETRQQDREPEERASPFLYELLNADWGRIEPHQERFPTAVEGALFGVLQAPWEDWVEFPTSADSGRSRPRIRDDVAHQSDLMSLGVPR
jgi:hypothetical protein